MKPPIGTVQRSYVTAAGQRVWLVNWGRHAGPASASSDFDLETGQAVMLGPDQKLRPFRNRP